MEWQQLEYFQRVAQMQHFTKAAESLFISQPALSRSVSRLEQELGVPLFERQGRSVQLNRYGEMFLEKVNKALQIIEEAKQELNEVVSPDNGNISLSFMHTLGTDLIPQLIGAYKSNYPNVTFQLFQSTADILLEQLKKGEVDLCLTTISEPHPEISRIELFSEEIYVIMPMKHRLAGQTEIELRDIANEPFIGFKKGVGLRNVMDQLCEQAGFTPKIMFEGQEVGTVTGFVSAGLGISLIPERKGMEALNVRMIPVKDPRCSRTIYLAWKERSYTPQIVQQFREFIVKFFNKDTLA